MNKQRRNYPAEEKVAMIRRPLLDDVTVSDLCDEHQLNLNLYSRMAERIF
jgi:transposase